MLSLKIQIRNIRFMEILSIRVMRGPNVWSGYRKKLIVMKLDLGKSEDFPTDKIDGFAEALETLMPSLRTHECSLGVEGGFLQRVKNGTWLGHVVEHIALEIQTLAGMDCGFGRTRSTRTKGVYNVVFSYELEEAGIYAAKAAVRIAQALASDQQYDLNSDLKELTRIYERQGLGPSTAAIVKEAQRRDIPYHRLDHGSMLMLGQGKYQKVICATVACTTSSIAVDLASDKESTKQFLTKSFVPMPKGFVIEEEDEIQNAIDKLEFPLVIKPVNGNHGRGVTTQICSLEQAKEAFRLAKKISDEVIVEKFISGIDYRFLVINFKLAAIAKRTPALVMGDDKSTIKQLIDETNNDPLRGEGHEKVLTTIKVDEITNNILVQKNLTLNSILPIGEILYLKDSANISSGGTARDVTDIAHPYNVFLAERIARLMNLDICGIDIITKDIAIPIRENTGAVLEVNAGPGFRMHLAPSKGLGRNVAEPVINMLYPDHAPSRIPIVAVTGTNGKTTTTRLIAHIAKQAGLNTGFSCSDGIYINGTSVSHGDCSGPESAEVVLRDPIVEYAVLETARGGILRAGLGFDKCNISIVTNISDDHLGQDDIQTLEEMAKVKIVVPRSTMREGYAILNADDELVYDMRKELDCNIALFSRNPGSERIRKHILDGGFAAIVENNYFVLCKGPWKTRIAAVDKVPITYSGKAECMISNVLPAILAASISNFSNEVITQALKNFIPSPELTPGRMNLFRFRNFRLMVDYAHNEGGFQELKKFMSREKATEKIAIIGGTGDRRDKDIRNLGAYAAQIFDKIIIRHDKDNRGRTKEELTTLLTEGIRSVKPEMPVTVISDESEALQYAIDHAKEGSFIFVCADEVHKTLELVTNAFEAKNGVPARDLINEN
jgi:cyanophycin synthetase